jgi:uncharacterized protein (TIGR03545 family)
VNKKLPKLFSKPLSGEELDKKVFKKIFVKEYRAFLDQALIKDEAGSYTVRESLDKKELAKLKKIAASVRKNTGFIQKGKLIFVGILVGVIVLFNLLFKDMLVEMAAESGLEAVFGARCDIQGLTFQILGGRIAFGRLEVANSESPMKNLFELGSTEIKINVVEILKGNVVLENVMCEEIQWGTPRAFSGALPGRKPPKEMPKDEKTTNDPFAFLNEAKTAAGDILEAEKDKLVSLKTLESLAKEYPDRIDAWEKKLNDFEKSMETVTVSVKKAGGLDPAKIKTLADAAAAFEVINKAYKDVTSFKKDLDTAYKDFGTALSTVKADQKQLSDDIASDTARLEKLLTAPLGSGDSIITTFIDKLLTAYLGDLWSYAKLALSYREMLKPTGEQKLKEEPPERQYGFVRFPGVGYPKFIIQNASFSAGSLQTDYIRGTFSNITGEPDLAGAPAVFTYEQKTGSRVINVTGAFDGRSTSSEAFKTDVTLSGFPYSLAAGLEFLNISRFSGTVKLAVGFSIDKDGRTAGSVGVDLTDLSFVKGNSPSRYVDRAFDALAKVKEIRIKGGYRYNDSGAIELKLNSNLDEMLGAIIKELADEIMGEVKAKLKAEFDKLLAGPLKDYQGFVSDFVKLDEIFKGDFSSLTNATKILDRKKDDVTKAANPLSGSAGRELDKLKKQFGF